MKADYDSIEIEMLEYVEYLRQYPNKLWELQLNKGRVSKTAFAKRFGLPNGAIFEHKKERKVNIINPINDMLLEEGVALYGITDGGAEIRRQMLVWWNSLNINDKMNLPIFGNKLNLQASLYKFLAVKKVKQYEIVKKTLEQFNVELDNLGLFSALYISVKERENNRDKDFHSRANKAKTEWFELGDIQINSVSDLVSPTDENPFIQIEQAFSWKCRDVNTSSSKANYRQACKFFILFLKNEGFDKHVNLKDCLNEFTLLHFRNFLYETDYTSKNTILSSVRLTLQKLKNIDGLGIGSIHTAPSLGSDKRTTDSYKPLPREFRDVLDEAIDKAISESESASGSARIFPYFLKLMRVTAINKEVALELEVDDFEECHRLTNKPCLRYWKERSTGAKELHLDIFKAKLQWLSTKQKQTVRDVFSNVIKLTEDIRFNSKSTIGNKLFIYESDGRNISDSILQFNGKRSRAAFRVFKKIYLKNCNLDFYITQLRATVVSELLEHGASIREIQLLLGHASVNVTMHYLDKLDFNVTARKELNKALKSIHEKTITNEHLVAVSDDSELNNAQENEVIFRTALGGCRNILNPPSNVRTETYKEGTPCGQFNKCLSCSNLIITKSHLPELFAMQRDFESMLVQNNIANSPYYSVVNENLSILSSILDSGKSEFSSEELERAKSKSIYIDVSDSLGITL
ncbi:site-specific integrase [Shewanella decolorationis]|uniref:Phage integrase family protein n=1 Tax=Shewanella decolorationis S12 TaxID=1353536 RepID=A0ABN0PNE4_9GAMM|nr:site-specific integrase [Shewanella decolorationis]ESE41668.1 phage integrase family protein [Shewanella decolorationis S12]GLR33734.1 hypothetical protein GCM10007922_32930 [Shewanella decolorationis]